MREQVDDAATYPELRMIQMVAQEQQQRPLAAQALMPSQAASQPDAASGDAQDEPPVSEQPAEENAEVAEPAQDATASEGVWHRLGDDSSQSDATDSVQGEPLCSCCCIHKCCMRPRMNRSGATEMFSLLHSALNSLLSRWGRVGRFIERSATADRLDGSGRAVLPAQGHGTISATAHGQQRHTT